MVDSSIRFTGYSVSHSSWNGPYLRCPHQCCLCSARLLCRQRPDLAARFSAVFFCCCLLFLWASFKVGLLSGFSAFVILALSWVLAGFTVIKQLPGVPASEGFTEIVPVYWSEHWKYSRWVLVTAFVYQLTTQGYFWLAAALLSVVEVGNLRALYNMVLPLDQVFTAMSLVVLPVMCARYATQKMDGLVHVWKRYCSTWFIVTCGLVALIFFLGDAGDARFVRGQI